MAKGRITLLVVLAGLVAASYYLMQDKDGGDNRRGPGGGRMVSVKTVNADMREFTDYVEAIGTSKARESVVLTSRVSDTVSRIYFSDGQEVAKGDLLVELTSVEEAAELREAEGNVREAESQYKRVEDLVEQGNASTATLEAQQRRLGEVRSRLAATEARLADRQIRAPFDGVLGLRQVSEGSLITQSTPITTIDAIKIINLDFSVPERFISTLAPGQVVAAKVSAYPDREFAGVVKSIDSRVDPATRSVIVRAEVQNADLAIKPGMLMTVSVISNSWNGIGIPEEAIVPTGGKNYVFKVTDGFSERVEVKVGLRLPGTVEITDGLSVGDSVVIEGTLRLRNTKTKVRDINDSEEQQLGDAGGTIGSGAPTRTLTP